MKKEGLTIELTNELSEEIFFDSLCNGLSQISGYGIEVDFDASHYQQAKEKSKEKISIPSYEDVLMQILRDGNPLLFVDQEGGEDYNRTIYLQDVHERVKTAPIEDLLAVINEDSDASNSDIILQSVLYGEIIFG
jgi:hypothetical protein